MSIIICTLINLALVKQATAQNMYTITQAQDWPMFQFMFSIVMTTLFALFGTVGFTWKNLSNRIDKVDSRLNNVSLKLESLVK